MVRWMYMAAVIACASVGCGGDDGAVGHGGSSGGSSEGSGSDGAPVDPAECGPAVDGNEPADPACVGVEAELIVDPQTESERFLNQVLEDDWAYFRGIVGQYACGVAPLYRGQVAASDNAGDLGGGHDDGVMRGEAVLASLVSGVGLEVIPTIVEGPHLIIFSPQDETRFFMHQPREEPGQTGVSIISSYRSSFGLRGSCDDCLVDLEQRPDDIAIELTASGAFGNGDPLIVVASGTLARVPTEDVRWPDIVEVNTLYAEELVKIPAEFEACGNLLVREFTEYYSEGAPAPAGSKWEDYGSCTRTVSYTARWWVDTENLARHGIRDFDPQEPAYCCEEPDVGVGPFERECFDFDG